MNLRRPFALLLSLIFVFSGLAALEAKPVRNGAVTIELVSADASIQPGKPFWVALKLDHEAHWHTYWINPGTGYPTSVTWTLPPGFKAGPIVWPTPYVVKDTQGQVTGNGYEGTAFLFTEITPPADLAVGTSVTLKAATEWLMCKDSCMPGDAQLELTRPVKAEPAQPDMSIARLFNNAFADLPRPVKDWAFSASRDGKVVTLRIASRTDSPQDFGELHYFDENAVVDYSAPQKLKRDGKIWVLEMALAGEEAAAQAPGLKGILVATGGFSGTGPKAVHIEQPFEVKEPIKAAQKDTPATPAKDAGAGTPPATGGGSSAAAPAASTLLGTLFLAFAGGLVLNLMPCVFPVLGIKIMGFVNQSGSDKAKVVQHGLMFAVGVLVSFWALAGALLALRAGGAQLGWGFQLQSPAFVFAMASFLLVFALNLSGLFEVGLSATGAGASLQSKEGLAGSFFTGMLATLVATPCSAPFLAPALGAALTLSPVESIAVFTAIAIGLALPYLLLSIFPQAIKLLPKPGAWMETFKQLMSFPLYATVGWLLWVLAGQTTHDDNALLMISFGFVLVAMAAWAYGRFGQAYGKPTKQLLGKLAAAALLVGGLWLGWPKSAEAAPAVDAQGKATYVVNWQKWSPEAVAAAQAAGKFVYVDFTARWCATCQTNKATVFHDSAVLEEFGRRSVVLFKADWTNKDPQITQELAKWNRSAVPFNLIYAPGKKDPIVLPELLTGSIVLAKLAEVAK